MITAGNKRISSGIEWEGGDDRNRERQTSIRNNCNKCMYVTTRVRLREGNL